MSLSNERIGHLARLARIALTDAEKDATRVRIDAILELVAQMRTADTSGVEPMSHPGETALRMRADVVTDTDRAADFQRIAPQTEARLYLVPKVIE